MSSPLLTPQQLAARWQVTVGWVYAKTRSGEIPKAPLIYADYAPSTHEAEMVARAFARGAGTNSGTNLSESESNSEQLNRSSIRDSD